MLNTGFIWSNQMRRGEKVGADPGFAVQAPPWRYFKFEHFAGPEMVVHVGDGRTRGVRQTERRTQNVNVAAGAFPPRVMSQVDFRTFYATRRRTDSSFYVCCFRSCLEMKNE